MGVMVAIFSVVLSLSQGVLPLEILPPNMWFGTSVWNTQIPASPVCSALTDLTFDPYFVIPYSLSTVILYLAC